MIIYRARFNNIFLRLLAYRPALSPIPEGHLKVVLQVVDGGVPIAEDPIHTEIMSELDLLRALHISRMEGWELTWEAREGKA